MKNVTAVFSVVVALVAGCSSSSSTTNAQDANRDYCARRVECGADALDCTKAFFGVHLPDACVPAARAATCTELNDKSSAVQKICFPPCDINTRPVCENDRLTTCTTDGGTVDIECWWYCHNAGLTYQNACGTVAVSALAPKGGTVCVCK